MTATDVSLPAPLGRDDKATLMVVLDLIIPPSSDGRLPGASTYDVWAHVCGNATAELIQLVADELQELQTLAKNRFGLPFADLELAVAEALVSESRTERPNFLAALARHTAACYYQQDAVLEAIGMEARPPYPGGYDVHPGDLSLLEPVRARGKIYRDV